MTPVTLLPDGAWFEARRSADRCRSEARGGCCPAVVWLYNSSRASGSGHVEMRCCTHRRPPDLPRLRAEDLASSALRADHQATVRAIPPALFDRSTEVWDVGNMCFSSSDGG